MDTAQEAIVDLIIKTASSMHEVSGSLLGQKIKEAGLADALRKSCRTLKQFLTLYCFDIVWKCKSGGDDIYQLKDRAISEEPNDEASKDRATSVWKVLTNPKVTSNVAVNQTTGEFYVFHSTEAIPDNHSLINKLTTEDYRMIAHSFLGKVSNREDFAKALEVSNFWPHWTELVNSDKEIFEEWLKWREQNIVQMLRDRLIAAQLPLDLVDKAISKISRKHSHHQRLVIAEQTPSIISDGQRENKTPKKIGGSERSYGLSTSTKGKASNPQSHIRTVVMKAIAQMTDDDLRRIWLPLGVVIDVIDNAN